MPLSIKRHEFTSHGFDPTTSVTWTITIGPIKIELKEFFGGVTSRGYVRGREQWFTSSFIHPQINRLATAIHEHYENKFQEEQYADPC